MKPRQPTDEEKAELLNYVVLASVIDPDDEDRQTFNGLIEDAAIAVFDHYITDGPVYSGKVMMVVWSGAPERHEVFIWVPTGAGDSDQKVITKVSCCG